MPTVPFNQLFIVRLFVACRSARLINASFSCCWPVCFVWDCKHAGALCNFSWIGDAIYKRGQNTEGYWMFWLRRTLGGLRRSSATIQHFQWSFRNLTITWHWMQSQSFWDIQSRCVVIHNRQNCVEYMVREELVDAQGWSACKMIQHLHHESHKLLIQTSSVWQRSNRWQWCEILMAHQHFIGHSGL